MYRNLHKWYLIVTFVGVLTVGVFYLSPVSWGAVTQTNPDQEIQILKEKVAQATRMLVRENLLASSGHVSARIPGTNKVLIGPRDVSRAILQADDLVTVDLDSHKVEGKRNPPRETEIHTGIYRARSDVMAVIHSHPVHSVIFSINQKPILPVTVHGAIFAEGVPVLDHVGHVDSQELGDKLARVLGPRSALLMKMHGAVIVGSSVEEAFVFALHLEENAEKQLWAEASGTVVSMTPNEVEESLSVAFGKSSIEKRWQYYREKEKMALQRER